MTARPKIASLIVAAGTAQRLQDGDNTPKQYRALTPQQSVLEKTLDCFISHNAIDRVVCVIHADHHDLYHEKTTQINSPKLVKPVIGGKTRQESVYNGLKALDLKGSDRPDYILVHDAARPFLPPEIIDRIVGALNKGAHSVTPSIRPVDTVKYTAKTGNVEKTVQTLNRNEIHLIQTPQGFIFDELLAAHQQYATENLTENFTDDTSLIEQNGIETVFVLGDADNFKITTAEDYKKAYLKMNKKDISLSPVIGSGYDVHRLVSGRPLILCNVEIPHDKGLDGHSDADVALHALTDAILGALGAGDIGLHFPPSEKKWKNADSALFLAKAMDLLRQKGGQLGNIDLTILAEQPKILPHRQKMIDRLADLTNLPANRINIKATTTEGLGFVGREEGIAAQATIIAYLPDSGSDA